jgi:hypothetical protein
MSSEERLAALESRCRRLTGVVWGCLALVGVFVSVAAERADDANVRAGRVEVVDEEGRVRVSMGKEDAGYGIVVYDEEGQFRSTLTYAPGGAVIQLRGEQGDVRLVATDDGTGVTAGSANGRAGIVATQERAHLEVRDADGNVVFTAPTLE